MKTFIIGCIIVMVLFVWGTFALDKNSCIGQWERSGMGYEWGPVKGCLIQREDGTWIPAEAYKETTR